MVFVPLAAVGAVGVPVSAGEASGAYVEDADAVVRYPEIDAPAGIVTVPVNVGDASGAYPVTQVNPVPLVYCSALPVAEHEGIAKAVTPAVADVTFASNVFAAILDRLLIAMPLVKVGEFANVAVPFTVMLLNVGLGYVWASTDSGSRSAASRIFFISRLSLGGM